MIKKNTMMIAFAMVGILLLGLGIVGASDGVNFENPLEGANYSGDVYVNWTNSQSKTPLFLQYSSEGCDEDAGWLTLDAFDVEDNDYSWSTGSLSDGAGYCMRLISGNVTFDTTGNFTIDNTNPEVEILSVTDGEEKGSKVKLKINKSDNIALKSCVVDWGNGETDDCGLDNEEKTLKERYKDNGDYSVNVVVEDYAGNIASDSVIAHVDNLVPYLVEITVPSVIVEGYPITIEGDASDVNADMPITNWLWKIDGVSISTAQDLVYTFSSEGDYNVSLTATDKDGGSNTTMVVVSVEEAIGLASYEVRSKEKLKEVEKIDEIKDIDVCDLVYASEDGISVTRKNDKKCKIVWTPRNNQTGDQFAIFNVSNGTDVEYYSVNISVYSWMVNLGLGLNMFSVPLVPESNSINDVLDSDVSGNADVIWAYVYDEDEGKNVWKYNEPLSDGSRWTAYSSRLQEIVPGYGYQIVMNGSVIVKGSGDMTQGLAQTPPEVKIVNGWNLLSHYGLDDLTHAKSFDSFSYGSVIEHDGSSADGNTEREGAYWVHASSDGSYAPSQEAIDSVM